jgi:hypothetical protein
VGSGRLTIASDDFGQSVLGRLDKILVSSDELNALRETVCGATLQAV